MDGLSLNFNYYPKVTKFDNVKLFDNFPALIKFFNVILKISLR